MLIEVKLSIATWKSECQELGADVGVAQAKPLLFQDLFARECCYVFGVETHFPYRNGRHKAAPALEEYTNRPPRQAGDVVL